MIVACYYLNTTKIQLQPESRGCCRIGPYAKYGPIKNSCYAISLPRRLDFLEYFVPGESPLLLDYLPRPTQGAGYFAAQSPPGTFTNLPPPARRYNPERPAYRSCWRWYSDPANGTPTTVIHRCSQPAINLGFGYCEVVVQGYVENSRFG